MGNDQGAGVAGQGLLDQFAGINGVDGHRALGHHGGIDNRVGGVEKTTVSTSCFRPRMAWIR
jgi:hypothetical protein